MSMGETVSPRSCSRIPRKKPVALQTRHRSMKNAFLYYWAIAPRRRAARGNVSLLVFNTRKVLHEFLSILDIVLRRDGNLLHNG